jgi:hypothetical protein
MEKRVALAVLASLVLFALLVFPAVSSGQRSPSPPEGHPGMAGMAPVMGSMMENMMASWVDFLAKPGTTVKLANFTKNYYDALRAKGFSKEEAIRLVASTGTPNMAR